MAQGLVLLAYNVYYNRFLKFEASLADYIDKSEGSDYLIQNVNFNPSDGLNTSHIIGKGELDNGLSFTDYSYTYALVIEYNSELKTRDEIYADEDTRIISKWFILDNDRTRGGQYKIDLRRDVIVDYMKQIRKSPIFVEKGIIADADNPLLLNNEDVRVNQIKKEEILLKDKTDCPWLVLYLKKGVVGNSQIGPDGNGKITLNVPSDVEYFEELTTPIASWQYFQYTTNDYNVRQSMELFVYWKYGPDKHKYTTKGTDESGLYVPIVGGPNTNLVAGNAMSRTKLDAAYNPEFNNIGNQLDSALGFKDLDLISVYDGKIVKDSLGKFYQIFVDDTGRRTTTSYDVTSAATPTAKATMTSCWNAANYPEPSQSANDSAFDAKIKYASYRIRIEPREDLNTVIDFGAYTGDGTKDSPLFDVVCMPYGALKIKAQGGLLNITSEATRSMLAMNGLARILTSQYVLDLQILPYFPLQDIISTTEEKTISIRYLTDTCLTGIHSGDYTDVLFVCESCNFTFNINKEITIANTIDVKENYFKKFLNDCTLLRLCSPNYNGLFEMNLAKNGGKISFFNVDVTLRPHNPYIHVNPDFEFLYGTDFNDVRGLICGGDFSLGIINDAWTVYEIQNKNYQAIFDRQIQNLDINNAIARQEAGWGIGAGIVSGAAAGATGGAIVGGGWGALAGAVIGAGTSAVGGALDWANLQKRQQEARNYAIDNYNLQLGNVRALPYSITKTSALTYNNKLFPFVEIYECSEEEKIAYYRKIDWNGMTIGIIDTIENYESKNWANYFRGKLIALYGEEGSNAVENRIIEAINMELMKGVFI